MPREHRPDGPGAGRRVRRVRVFSSSTKPPFPGDPETPHEIRCLSGQPHVQRSAQIDRADVEDHTGTGLHGDRLAVDLLGERFEPGAGTSPLELREGARPPAALDLLGARVVEASCVHVQVKGSSTPGCQELRLDADSGFSDDTGRRASVSRPTWSGPRGATPLAPSAPSPSCPSSGRYSNSETNPNFPT